GGFHLLAPQRRLQNREPLRGKRPVPIQRVSHLRKPLRKFAGTDSYSVLNTFSIAVKVKPFQPPGRAGGLPKGIYRKINQ
ncbi:MAG: hypothetical protein LBS49_06835, partial [Candidatus Accumulibacter sp.]|nr:hypothetical protein [Accumulibacter sp.]